MFAKIMERSVAPNGETTTSTTQGLAARDVGRWKVCAGQLDGAPAPKSTGPRTLPRAPRRAGVSRPSVAAPPALRRHRLLTLRDLRPVALRCFRRPVAAGRHVLRGREVLL